MLKILESIASLQTDLVDAKSSLEIAENRLDQYKRENRILTAEVDLAKSAIGDLERQLEVSRAVIDAYKEMGVGKVVQVASPTPQIAPVPTKTPVHRPDEAEEIIQNTVQAWWESEDEIKLLDWYHELPHELGIPKEADGKLLGMIRAVLHRDLRFHEKCMMRDLARSRLEHLDPADREIQLPKKLDAYKTTTNWQG